MSDLRVLVVDDEPIVAAGHAAYVERTVGFAVAGVAGTLRDAGRLLAAGPVDLVLLDLNLPDGHGLDLVRQLRVARSGVDVLPITSAREVGPLRDALALGVVGYLLKPFTYVDLADRLRGYARYRVELDATQEASQHAVDALFADLRRSAGGGAAPKGLTRDLLDAVVSALTAGEAMSASEVAHAVGTSRVTARRYLEYLADQGRVDRRSRSGGSGRPEVTFRWRA